MLIHQALAHFGAFAHITPLQDFALTLFCFTSVLVAGKILASMLRRMVRRE